MIIGYTYESDMHCPACSMLRFAAPDSIIAEDGLDEHGIPDSPAPKDKDGNEIHPMFSWQEHGYTEECECDMRCDYMRSTERHYYGPTCGDCCIEL